MNARQMIEQLILDKSTASVDDVVAALAIHPDVQMDTGSLEALQKIEKLEDICLVSRCGGSHVGNFRADWSCDSWGYGYKSITSDFREGFVVRCGTRPLYLSSRVRH